MENKKPLIVILGPTAVGKTSTAIKLAKQFHGEIVSADSRLLYRGMDIGTAKPTLNEQKQVPHHLINVAAPNEVWNLAIYQRRAYQTIKEIHERGILPFLVGGTGQYIRAIIEGWQIPPQRPNFSLRDVLTRWSEEIGKAGLHHRLQVIDPEAASIIDYRNLRRTVRALEVILITGKRFTDLRKKQASPYAPIILGINRPREELYTRIDQRVEAMLDSGLVTEVQNLLGTGYSSDLPTLSAIGYKEVISFLQGEISYDEAVALIKKHTRVFVRRQANWFKSDDSQIRWFDASEKMLGEMEDFIRRQLINVQK